MKKPQGHLYRPWLPPPSSADSPSLLPSSPSLARSLLRPPYRSQICSSLCSPASLPPNHAPSQAGPLLRRQQELENLYGFEEESPSHVPVLLQDVLEAFRGRKLRLFVDCTLGAGGHACAIVREHPEMETFVGLDVDPLAHTVASPNLQAAVDYRSTDSTTNSDLKVHLFRTNFRNIKCKLEQLELNLAQRGVDGILMDLGMSSMQLDAAERGFSLQKDGPADMRMDPLLNLKADDILNSWPEAEVARLLREYGEESRWRHFAQKIVEARLAGGIHSTSQLLEVIHNSISRKVSGRQGWKKSAIRIFQALRIAVNDELESLTDALSDAFTCLAPKGRLVVISFHSLEDRTVKQFFLKAIDDGHKYDKDSDQHLHIPGQTRYNNYRKRARVEGEGRKNIIEGNCAIILTKRPVVAGMDEIAINRKSRSAKLRVLEKK